MHSGHYNAIRQAKVCYQSVILSRLSDIYITALFTSLQQQLCDVLVVGIHTDEEITKHKGPPVMNNEQRYEIFSFVAAALCDLIFGVILMLVDSLISLSTVKSCKWADEICFGAPYVPSVALLVCD
jgi:hypothetical protein